jgi:hypothetical protein
VSAGQPPIFGEKKEGLNHSFRTWEDTTGRRWEFGEIIIIKSE